MRGVCQKPLLFFFPSLFQGVMIHFLHRTRLERHKIDLRSFLLPRRKFEKFLMNSYSYVFLGRKRAGTLAPRWNRAALKIGLGVTVLVWAGVASAQTRYERARVPLVGVVLTPTSVRQEPQASGKALTRALPDAQVRVIGRQGTWFHIETRLGKQTISGWLPGSDVKILGVALEKEEPPTAVHMEGVGPGAAAPPPAGEIPKTVSEKKHTPVSIRVIPRGGYAFGVKGLPNQIRAGADILFGLSKSTECGLALDGGFRHFRLLEAGPLVLEKLRWPRLGPFRTEVFGGFSIFYTSTDGSRKTYEGPRFGANLTYALAEIGSHEVEFLVQASTDIFLWGGERVLIPVTGSGGFGFHF